MLLRAGCSLLRASDIVALLSIVEQQEDLTAIVVDQELLGQQASSLLRAITKIRPQAGLVMITPDDTEPDLSELPKGVLVLNSHAAPEQLRRAILSATNLGSPCADTAPAPDVGKV